MSVPAFDPSLSYADFSALVRNFADTVPTLLSRHPETAALAYEIDKLRLKALLEQRFTVAVIGQMRAGKSTLVNALLGRALAPVGVNETTATINWFRHGEGERCNCFRVHWKDGSTDDLPLTRTGEWIGQEENAKRTRALDFFAESDFLKIANIVDTPGTRSVVKHHTEMTTGFLAEETDPAAFDQAQSLENESLAYGGRADAVVYVINPVARADDRDMLEMFGERTRLPGSFAYNSIAVVQKWEQLEPDALAEVAKKCMRLRRQLQAYVSEVMPVSGMLANLAAGLPAETWNDVARLACESQPDAFESLLLSAERFRQDTPGAALDTAARQRMLRNFEWAGIAFSLRLGRARNLGEGHLLRQAVHEASGIDAFREVLQARFFSLAGLIKASTVLRKAWAPCTVALLRLRELVQRREEEQRLGLRSEAILERLGSDAVLTPVRAYVSRSLAAVASDLRHAQEIREQIDALKEQAARNFHFLDEDLACLYTLGKIPPTSIDDDERAALRRLFGEQGPDIRTRLMVSEAVQTDGLITVAWDRRERWAMKKARAHGPLLKIYQHALDRLDKALEALEALEAGNEAADDDSKGMP